MAKRDLLTRSTLRFEALSQKLWPLIRPLCRRSIAPRCKQCVISSKAPGIELKDGLCNHCRAFNEAPTDSQSEEQRWEARYVEHQARELNKILTAYQGRGKRRWDALVLFSGGKDSVYMVYRIKQKYPGLRMLAVTWNNGFYSEIALDTARDAAKKLDLDHIIYKPSASVYRNLYRFTLMQIDESGSYGTVDRFDGTLNQHLGMRLGAEFEIPLVLTGVDWAQALLMGSLTYFEQHPQDLLARVDTERMERRSGLLVKNIFNKEDGEFYWDGSRWPSERVPRLLLPFVAWRPDKQEVARELESVGLVLSGHTSPLVTNNQVLSVMSAVDIVKIGYCSFEPEFADMIRLNRSDATYWRNVFEFLEFVVKKGWYQDRAFMELLRRLGLTLADIGLSDAEDQRSNNDRKAASTPKSSSTPSSGGGSMLNARKQAGAKRRVLFFGEAVTLAHVARPLVLAGSLDPERYEVFFASASRYDTILPNLGITRLPIHSISSECFLAALASGRPHHDTSTLRAYVKEDLRVLSEVDPDLVVGDFRLSLAVSTPTFGVPYMAVSNAYWSPYSNPWCPVPGLGLLTDLLPIPAAQWIFDRARPVAFARHARGLNRVRNAYGLPGLGPDLRRTYTHADCTLYADVPGHVDLHGAPPSHQFIGPVLWSATTPLPCWWNDVPLDRPLVYLNLGSSGDIRRLPIILDALTERGAAVMVGTAGRGELGPTPAHVFVSDYLPGEAAVERADLMICNGGSPSAHQALAAGVPVIGIASNLDQYLNMYHLEKNGAGLLVRSDRVTKRVIKRAIDTVFGNEKFSTRAQIFRRKIRAHDSKRLFPALVDQHFGDRSHIPHSTTSVRPELTVSSGGASVIGRTGKFATGPGEFNI